MKLKFLFLLIPCQVFAQSAIVKTVYAINKHGRIVDTIKTFSYPFIKCESGSEINNTIKTLVFQSKGYDTAKSLQKLLNDSYKKDSIIKMNYIINHNKNGLLSITINIIPKGDKKPPIYLNFDLSTGKLVTISNMLNNKNDSISFRQAVVPVVTDSIRLFEQSIDKNNPKYSEIIEWLNNSVADFRHNYPAEYILTDRELIVYFDCFMPESLLSYRHSYLLRFTYKTFKNTFKPEFIKRLLQ
jgi:hypothetical protein